jgi:hypothetical protein
MHSLATACAPQMPAMVIKLQIAVRQCRTTSSSAKTSGGAAKWPGHQPTPRPAVLPAVWRDLPTAPHPITLWAHVWAVREAAVPALAHHTTTTMCALRCMPRQQALVQLLRGQRCAAGAGTDMHQRNRHNR